MNFDWKLTRFHSIGQGNSSRRMKDGYKENCLHCWFIKTREGLSGVSRMHLRGGDNPDTAKKKKKEKKRPLNSLDTETLKLFK